jgi:hypothetical protein
VKILRKALHDITSIWASESEWPRHGRSPKREQLLNPAAGSDAQA